MSSKYGYLAMIGADTSGLKAALSDVDNETKKLTYQLKDIDKALAFNPDSTELLAQKFVNLSNQITQTKTKLEALKNAEQQVNAAYAGGSMPTAQYEEYRREVLNTEAALRDLTNAQNSMIDESGKIRNVTAALDQTAYATKGLGGALSEIEAAGKSFDTELKEIDASLRSGGGAEILEQKYNVLSQAVENTQNKLEALKSAEENMSAGAASGSVTAQEQREYQRELESTSNKLERYRQELQQTWTKLDELEAASAAAAEGTGQTGDAAGEAAAEFNKFKADIGNFDNSVATLKSQMSEINNALKLNPGNTELLRQKYNNLGNQIAQTKAKLNELKNAQQEVNAAFVSGNLSREKYEDFRREVLNTEAALQELIRTQDSMIDESGNIRDVSNEFKNLDNNIQNAGKNTITLGDLIKANVLSDYIRRGISELASAFGNFVKQGVELASDLTEVQNVVDTTFGDGAAEIYEWANAAAESFGMSSLSAQQYTGTLGAMLKSSGIANESIVEMSENLVGLAGDMASFHNLDVEAAFEKIRSGIMGETEPLSQLGVDMRVASLEAYALAQGIDKTWDSMSSAEQTMIRYNYILSQTADMQGDYSKTIDSYANQQRNLQLQIENLSAALGEKLLPHLNDVISTANEKLPEIEGTVENIGEILSNVTEFALDHYEVIMSLATAYLTFQGAMKIGNGAQTVVTKLRELTTTTQAATAAQEGLNAAQKANLFIAVASAIAAVTVAAITYANSIDNVGNKVKGLNEEFEKTKQTATESIETSEEEIAVIEHKAQKYEELLNTENRTAGQEQQLKDLAEELQEYIPEGTRLIDEQTGAYNSLAGSIDSVVESMRNRAKMNAYEEELTELYKQQLDAEKAVNELEENFEKTGWYLGEKHPNAANARGIDKTAYNLAKEQLDEYTAEIESLDKILDNLYEKEGVDLGGYANGTWRNQEYTNKYNTEQENLEKEKQLRDQALADYVADLDTRKKLRKIDEDEYFSKLKNYLDENQDTESEAWFDQLERYEDYQQDKIDAAKKAADEDQKETQKKADEKQAQYEKDVEDYANSLKDKLELDDKYTEEMYYDDLEALADSLDEQSELYKKYNNEVLKGRKKLADDLSKQQSEDWKKSTEELSEQLADAYDELTKQKEAARKELLNIDLSETVTDENGNDIEVLTDLDAEARKIDEYIASLEKLKATGISDDLLAEISKMSYEDGSRQRYINTLLGLSEDKRQLYYSDWERLNETEKKAEQALFGEQEEELNKQASDAVKKVFGEAASGAYDEGVETAMNSLRGITDTLGYAPYTAAVSGFMTGAFQDTAGSGQTGSAAGAGYAGGERYIAASTPITINLNDQKFIKTTLLDLIGAGNRSGGNVFNL